MAKICSLCRRRHTSQCAEMPHKLVKLALAAVTIRGVWRRRARGAGGGVGMGCSCLGLHVQVFVLFCFLKLNSEPGVGLGFY